MKQFVALGNNPEKRQLETHLFEQGFLFRTSKFSADMTNKIAYSGNGILPCLPEYRSVTIAIDENIFGIVGLL